MRSLLFRLGEALERVGRRLQAGEREPERVGEGVRRVSPQVGLTAKSVEMIEAGMQPAPAPKEPEEPLLRGSLESRFPHTTR